METRVEPQRVVLAVPGSNKTRSFSFRNGVCATALVRLLPLPETGEETNVAVDPIDYLAVLHGKDRSQLYLYAPRYGHVYEITLPFPAASIHSAGEVGMLLQSCEGANGAPQRVFSLFHPAEPPKLVTDKLERGVNAAESLMRNGWLLQVATANVPVPQSSTNGHSNSNESVKLQLALQQQDSDIVVSVVASTRGTGQAGSLLRYVQSLPVLEGAAGLGTTTGSLMSIAENHDDEVDDNDARQEGPLSPEPLLQGVDSATDGGPRTVPRRRSVRFMDQDSTSQTTSSSSISATPGASASTGIGRFSLGATSRHLGTISEEDANVSLDESVIVDLADGSTGHINTPAAASAAAAAARSFYTNRPVPGSSTSASSSVGRSRYGLEPHGAITRGTPGGSYLTSVIGVASPPSAGLTHGTSPDAATMGGELDLDGVGRFNAGLSSSQRRTSRRHADSSCAGGVSLLTPALEDLQIGEGDLSLDSMTRRLGSGANWPHNMWSSNQSQAHSAGLLLSSSVAAAAFGQAADPFTAATAGSSASAIGGSASLSPSRADQLRQTQQPQSKLPGSALSGTGMSALSGISGISDGRMSIASSAVGNDGLAHYDPLEAAEAASSNAFRELLREDASPRRKSLNRSPIKAASAAAGSATGFAGSPTHQQGSGGQQQQQRLTSPMSMASSLSSAMSVTSSSTGSGSRRLSASPTAVAGGGMGGSGTFRADSPTAAAAASSGTGWGSTVMSGTMGSTGSTRGDGGGSGLAAAAEALRRRSSSPSAMRRSLYLTSSPARPQAPRAIDSAPAQRPFVNTAAGTGVGGNADDDVIMGGSESPEVAAMRASRRRTRSAASLSTVMSDTGSDLAAAQFVSRTPSPHPHHLTSLPSSASSIIRLPSGSYAASWFVDITGADVTGREPGAGREALAVVAGDEPPSAFLDELEGRAYDVTGLGSKNGDPPLPDCALLPMAKFAVPAFNGDADATPTFLLQCKEEDLLIVHWQQSGHLIAVKLDLPAILQRAVNALTASASVAQTAVLFEPILLLGGVASAEPIVPAAGAHYGTPREMLVALKTGTIQLYCGRHFSRTVPADVGNDQVLKRLSCGAPALGGRYALTGPAAGLAQQVASSLTSAACAVFESCVHQVAAQLRANQPAFAIQVSDKDPPASLIAVSMASQMPKDALSGPLAVMPLENVCRGLHIAVNPAVLSSAAVRDFASVLLALTAAVASGLAAKEREQHSATCQLVGQLLDRERRKFLPSAQVVKAQGPPSALTEETVSMVLAAVASAAQVAMADVRQRALGTLLRLWLDNVVPQLSPSAAKTVSPLVDNALASPSLHAAVGSAVALVSECAAAGREGKALLCQAGPEAVAALLRSGVSRASLAHLPQSASLALRSLLTSVASHPPPSWLSLGLPASLVIAAYLFIDRLDLAAMQCAFALSTVSSAVGSNISSGGGSQPSSKALLSMAHRRLFCSASPPAAPLGALGLLTAQGMTGKAASEAGTTGQAAAAIINAALGTPDMSSGAPAADDSDGLLALLQHPAFILRSPADQRMRTLASMLQSSRPRRITVHRGSEASDHEHMEAQATAVMSNARFSVACPSGRAALTFGTCVNAFTDPVAVPVMTLAARLPPKDLLLKADVSNIAPALYGITDWQEFANGVAAGLRFVGPSTSSGAGGSAGGGVMSRLIRSWVRSHRYTGTPPDLSAAAASAAAASRGLANLAGGEGRPAGGAASGLVPANPAHGGLLLAFGMQGLLNSLTSSDLYDALAQTHAATTVGLLLGLAAGKRGSMETAAAKAISLHIPAVLPGVYTDLEVPPVVQSNGLIALGLLYQGTGHRAMSEFCLRQLHKGPVPMTDGVSPEREAYCAAAGFALGLINLGAGLGSSSATGEYDGPDGGPATDLPFLSAGTPADLRLDDELIRCIVGGRWDDGLLPLGSGGRPRLAASPTAPASSPSSPSGNNGRPSLVWEPKGRVNTHVTAVPAILALGLTYLRSGNQRVADHLALPDSLLMLEAIRHDVMLLRVTSRALVMWGEHDADDGDRVFDYGAWCAEALPHLLGQPSKVGPLEARARWERARRVRLRAWIKAQIPATVRRTIRRLYTRASSRSGAGGAGAAALMMAQILGLGKDDKEEEDGESKNDETKQADDDDAAPGSTIKKAKKSGGAFNRSISSAASGDDASDDDDAGEEDLDEMDVELVCTAYACALAGACLGLGLRYAGTADAVVRDELLGHLTLLHCLREARSTDSASAYPRVTALLAGIAAEADASAISAADALFTELTDPAQRGMAPAAAVLAVNALLFPPHIRQPPSEELLSPLSSPPSIYPFKLGADGVSIVPATSSGTTGKPSTGSGGKAAQNIGQAAALACAPPSEHLDMSTTTVAMSLALVMAGTCDVGCLQLMRELRRRVTPGVSYGTCMGLSTATGLLGLAGGRGSFSRSNESIAALLASCVPHWPSGTAVNAYWPQAPRSLWALAVDMRGADALCVSSSSSAVFISSSSAGLASSAPVVDAMEPVAATLDVTVRPAVHAGWTSLRTLHLTTPCTLPERHAIHSIRVGGPGLAPYTLYPGDDPVHARIIGLEEAAGGGGGDGGDGDLAASRSARGAVLFVQRRSSSGSISGGRNGTAAAAGLGNTAFDVRSYLGAPGV